MNPVPFLPPGHPSRREFLERTILASAAATVFPAAVALGAEAGAERAMRLCLTPGSIGVGANQMEAIALAEKHGFEAVEPFGSQLATLPDAQISELTASLKSKRLAWGAAGLPVEFRQGADRFGEGLRSLPSIAEALSRAGVVRVGTWISPASTSLTYVQNFRQHADRLRAVAQILKERGLRLGLEYVGTFTSRVRARYPFIHTLAETRDLIAEIGTGNVGLVLDSWHWWQAEDTVQDLHSLTDAEVVSVDLNDAPANVAKDQQADGRRELPAATGVIDHAAFLKALQRIGYTGPVRAEPFNKALNDLENDAACAATIAAMRKAFQAVGS
jgi:sugar phosphate isomerase/epimerase